MYKNLKLGGLSKFMFRVDGRYFSQKADYEAALEDKKVIEDIKARYDLNNPVDIKKLYLELQNVRFLSEIGKDFDDEIYERFQNLEKASVKPSSKASNTDSLKEKKKRLEEDTKKLKKDFDKMDSKTRKEVLKELKKQYVFRTAIIVVLVFLSFGSIGYFVKYYMDARNTDKSSENLAALKNAELAEYISVSQVFKHNYTEDVVIPDILDEYKILYNKNKSLIGWLTIADTNIDYPVMQTVNNEYYLSHDFNQEEDANGCIFMDKDCDVVLGSTNYILYGHHMQSGKMFGGLIKYGNEDFYEDHKTVLFDTIYEKGEYEVMYVFRSHIYNSDEIAFKYYQFINANSAEEFESYMEEMDKLSLFDTGVTASYGDQLLTLSTCDYQEANGRFVVVCKRIK